MSRLRIYTDTAPETTLLDSRDGTVISAELARIGVTFERWQANQPIEPGAPQETVIAAYGDRSTFNNETINLIREMRRAANSFSSLARSIERNPQAFILGR